VRGEATIETGSLVGTGSRVEGELRARRFQSPDRLPRSKRGKGLGNSPEMNSWPEAPHHDAPLTRCERKIRGMSRIDSTPFVSSRQIPSLETRQIDNPDRRACQPVHLSQNSHRNGEKPMAARSDLWRGGIARICVHLSAQLGAPREKIADLAVTSSRSK